MIRFHEIQKNHVIKIWFIGSKNVFWSYKINLLENKTFLDNPVGTSLYYLTILKPVIKLAKSELKIICYSQNPENTV